LNTSPALSLIFTFFGSFLGILLLPAPSFIIKHLLPLFSKVFYPLPDPPYPLPPFLLFGTIYRHFFCKYFCFILSIHIHTWYIALNNIYLTTFGDAISCQGRGNELPISAGTRPLESV
jgi:hypothetical protein